MSSTSPTMVIRMAPPKSNGARMPGNSVASVKGSSETLRPVFGFG